VSFSFRFSASYLLTDEDKILKYNVIAYDLQALLAVFLWVKTLSLLDGNQYFGKTLRETLLQHVACYSFSSPSVKLTFAFLS
jgi:hypothetical protein